MNLAGYYLIYAFSKAIGLLPFPVLYGFSSFLSFFLNKILGYRKKIVRHNLSICFPEWSKERICQVSDDFYDNLSDVIIEGIKAFSISRRQVMSRYRILNPELVVPYLEKGQSVICVTGHYGNWEWGALAPPLQLPWKYATFYKPLNNPRIDQYVRKNRSRFGIYLSPIRETTRTFEDRRGRSFIYIMAADQSPSNREMAYWTNFLGRDTAFLHGPEKHARINNIPVFFTAIRRIKRGYYELSLSLITSDPTVLPEGEITRRYAMMLESLIKESPANWLWSHKRWKLTR